MKLWFFKPHPTNVYEGEQSHMALIECTCGQRWAAAHSCPTCKAEFPKELIRKRDFLNRMAGTWQHKVLGDWDRG